MPLSCNVRCRCSPSSGTAARAASASVAPVMISPGGRFLKITFSGVSAETFSVAGSDMLVLRGGLFLLTTSLGLGPPGEQLTLRLLAPFEFALYPLMIVGGHGLGRMWLGCAAENARRRGTKANVPARVDPLMHWAQLGYRRGRTIDRPVLLDRTGAKIPPLIGGRK